MTAWVDRWWAEQPRRPPEVYASQLARARFWREDRRFIATFHELEEVAPLLELDPAFAHAFVLVLSQLPAAARLRFAAEFYSQRSRRHYIASDPDPMKVAPATALLVLGLAEHPALSSERLLDLLHGAAQGDDPSLTPEVALGELRKIVARIRLDVELDDPNDPRAAAATAVVETIDPSSGVVPLQEVLVRAAWAAVHSWEPPRVLEFLLEVDALLD